MARRLGVDPRVLVDRVHLTQLDGGTPLPLGRLLHVAPKDETPVPAMANHSILERPSFEEVKASRPGAQHPNLVHSFPKAAHSIADIQW